MARAEFEVVADRLLEHDARERRDDAVRFQALAHGAVDVRRCREIEHAHALDGIRQPLAQIVPSVIRSGVDLHIGEAAAEAGEHIRVAVRSGHELVDRLLRMLAEILVRKLGPGRADDAALRRHLAVAKAVIERRQQLAAGKIARGAEYHGIEGRDRDDLGHDRLSFNQRSVPAPPAAIPRDGRSPQDGPRPQRD